MYTDIAEDLDQFKIDKPTTNVPSPNDDDYRIGFIRRYFIRRSNDIDAHIFEVDDVEHSKYINNPFWTIDSVKWRISGPISPVYKDDGTLIDKGVTNSNKAAIGLAAKNLKNIALYLPNLLQFYLK
jgi:hypothetical protein